MSYPFFIWMSSPVDWKPCITETWHHLQVRARTFFRLEMDASKSPIRFFTRARMNRKCGWFLQNTCSAARITDSYRILKLLSNTSLIYGLTMSLYFSCELGLSNIICHTCTYLRTEILTKLLGTLTASMPNHYALASLPWHEIISTESEESKMN